MKKIKEIWIKTGDYGPQTEEEKKKRKCLLGKPDFRLTRQRL